MTGQADDAALLTCHGTLLCRAPDGTLRQDAIDDARAIPAAPQSLRLAPGRDPRVVTVAEDGLFLRADPDRARVAFDRDAAHAHEHFLMLRAEDLVILRALLGKSWIVKSSLASVAPAAGRFVSPFLLDLGAMTLDLRAQLPFDGPTLPLRVPVFTDGWRPDTLCLYRPLVMIAAFRSEDVLAQAGIALDSLVRHGAYRGEILVLTDRKAEDLLRRAPSVDPGRLRTVALAPSDRVGCLASRYAMTEIDGIMRHQPILYADADTVFDAPIDALLRALAGADRIAAPIEMHSEIGRRHWAGSDMLRGAPTGSFLGFNSGTLGIPNVIEHADTIRLIRRITANRSAVFGRDHFGCVDQPIANYAAWRRGGFETREVTQFVRWGHPGLSTAPARRLGIAHFYPPGTARAKAEAMRAYLDALDG